MAEFQTTVAEWLTLLAALLPFGYTFGAGMVAGANPCGFAMLPAYLSLYLGLSAENERSVTSRWRDIISAAWVGISVSAGFMVLFTLAGLLLAAGGSFLMPIMPWVGTVIGLALVVLALLSLSGIAPTLTLAQRAGNRMMPARQRSGRTFFLFGLAYGVASLSCTIPIFMIAAGSALASASFVDGIVRTFTYALGMASVIVTLTLALALFKGTIVQHFKLAIPYVHLASAILLMVAGGWIVIYWTPYL